MLNSLVNKPPKQEHVFKAICNSTTVIRVMHGTPIEPKYYIIIPLSYSGWCFCCWQDCSCGCVVTLMLLIWLGPECIHATHILYCIAYPLSLFVSTSPSSVSLHLCHFFNLVNYMYCCSSLLMRAQHWGLFYSRTSFNSSF